MKIPKADTLSGTSRDFSETVATAIVCISCIAGPLALGGTHPLAIAGLNAGMAILTVLWAAFFRPSRLQLAIPLVVFLGAFLQLLPLPDSLLVWLAPISAGAWKVAHEGLPHSWGRISIDPAETAAAARHGLLAMGAVAAVCSIALRHVYRRWIIVSMALSGATIWILGLLFPVKVNSFTLLGFVDFRGPLMPGRTPLEPPYATAAFGFPDLVEIIGRQYHADSWVVGDGFGPYLITNHFAGALTLTIPMLAAILLFATRNHLPTWMRCGAVAVLFAGAFATLGLVVRSRAGAASFLLAALIFGCFTARAGTWRTFIAAVTIGYVAVVSGFIVALFGPFEGFDKWFPVRFQPGITALLTDGRIVACHVAERMFLASPLLGTGLGTYGDLYPRMVGDGSPWYFAHNEYAQLLAEAGLAGLLVLGCLFYLLMRSAITFWRNATQEDRIFGAAAWAALAGIVMHSCFDWNLRVPANAFLACVVTGLAFATGFPSLQEWEAHSQRKSFRAAFVAAIMLAVLATSAFQLRDTASEYVQRELREAVTAARQKAGDTTAPPSQQSLVAAIAAGEQMTKWDPGDAQLAVVLGQANLHLAALPIPMEKADEALENAAAWFHIARLNCAVSRGIAEPRP